MAAGRVEQVTAIHRFNIMEFRTGLFIGDRYRQVTVIAGSTVYIQYPDKSFRPPQKPPYK